ncbi:hypothetical protein Tco_1125007 [Tanacetum coccineum]|uniref:Uncharacterized protein n=1 Tax=Tanacetum coccineum TaxID=301880 RepID=A0ABQ5J7R6_9ASTR
MLPLWTADLPFYQDPKSYHDDGSKPLSDNEKKVHVDPRKDSERNDQEKEDNVNNTNNVNAASTNEVNVVGGKTSIELPVDPNMPALKDYSIFDFTRDDEDDGVVADMNNLDTTIQVSPIPTTRIHKDHPLDQVIGDLQSATQTRKMSKNFKEHGKEEKSLNNNSFLSKYECSSLALDIVRDEKKRLDHLKQDQTMLVIKRFSERKKVFSERKKTGKIRANSLVRGGMLGVESRVGWLKEYEEDKKSEKDGLFN